MSVSNLIDVSQHKGLDVVDGFPFPVLASGGAEPAARAIAARTARAWTFLGEVLATAPDIALLVLSRGDWGARTANPYGVGEYRRGNLIWPGEGDDAWRDVAELLAGGPEDVAAEARRVYGTPDGALDLSPYWDLGSIHELGHAFHFQAKLQLPRSWLWEFFANQCVYAYAASVEPELLPAVEAVPRLAVALGAAAYRHRSLADLEALYLGVGKMNYVWYQFHLQVEAKHVFGAAGTAGLRRLWEAFLPPAPDSEGELSDERLADLLARRVHPRMARVLTHWPGGRP